MKMKLPTNFTFSYSTALSQIRWNNLNRSGRSTPLHNIEPKLLSLILCMSNIKRSLTASEGLMLANELLHQTQSQQNLFEWKRQHKIFHKNDETFMSLGKSYWNGF